VDTLYLTLLTANETKQLACKLGVF